jgi:hypothetical protein
MLLLYVRKSYLLAPKTTLRARIESIVEVAEMNEADTGSQPRSRKQALSDLLFGLALSIGALTLIG